MLTPSAEKNECGNMQEYGDERIPMTTAAAPTPPPSPSQVLPGLMTGAELMAAEALAYKIGAGIGRGNHRDQRGDSASPKPGSSGS